MSGLQRQQAQKTRVETSLERRIVLRARELITDYSNWIFGKDVATAEGKPCPISSSAAQKFCHNGAVLRAAFELADAGYTKIADRIIYKQALHLTYGVSPHQINDSGTSEITHKRVLKLLDDTADKLFPT